MARRRLSSAASAAPSPQEIERRKREYFAPYHAALAAELKRLRAMHKTVALYDCHSIRSVIPRLFPGELPVFNIGTNDGRSCDPKLTEQVASICAASRWPHIVNGRFKGGWITRRYGRPGEGVHALQLEVAQAAYMDEAPPWPWDAARAAPLVQLLARFVDALAGWRPEARA
jgi:formiminoglutamase